MRLDPDAAAADRDVIGVDDDPGPGQQDEAAAAHIGVHLQRRTADHGRRQVQPDAAARRRGPPSAAARSTGRRAWRCRCRSRSGRVPWPRAAPGRPGGQWRRASQWSGRQLAVGAAVSATSSRSSSSSGVSRPSPAATRSSSTTLSRSECDALSSARALSSPGWLTGETSPVMGHTVSRGCRQAERLRDLQDTTSFRARPRRSAGQVRAGAVERNRLWLYCPASTPGCGLASASGQGGSRRVRQRMHGAD